MGSLLSKHVPLPIVIAIVVMLVLAGAREITRPIAGRSIALGTAYTGALCAYAKAHEGRLPSSLRSTDFRSFVQHRGASETETEKRFKEFESYYDVAWDTGAWEVDANGFIPSRKRFLIQAAMDSPAREGGCEELSRRLAMDMKRAAATTSAPE